MAAARVAVDAAEQLVRDPRPLVDLLAGAGRGWEPPTGSAAEPAAEHPRVEHIKVRPADGAATSDDAGTSGGGDPDGRSADL